MAVGRKRLAARFPRPVRSSRASSTLRNVRPFEFDAPAVTQWLEEQMGRPVRYEKVEHGDEQILPPREQRELDALPSALDRTNDDSPAG